jgi:DNA-binding IclR family transcriptional regulator
MGSDNTSKKKIKSTQKAFDIIDAIAESEKPSVTDIANEVEYSRSTVHYHLQTLQQGRYVIRDEEGLRLGLRMARFGDLALRKHRLSGIVEEPADELTEEIGGVAHAAVKQGNKLVWLYRSEGSQIGSLSTALGKQAELHCTAYGQAILAYLSEGTLDTVISESGLPARTESTITTRDALEDRLSAVRQVGFAYSSEEFEEGIASIASPIIDTSDGVVGAIGITNVDSQIEDPYMHAKARRHSDEIASRVRDTARVVSDNLNETD